MPVYGTKSNLDPEEIIRRAGELTVEYKRKGFHCPEAAIRGIPEAFGIAMPADVIRSACGFFGGGGGIGGRCGLAEAGVMILSFLYGRMHPLQSEQQVRAVVGRMLLAFKEEMGSLECREIKPGEVQKYGAAIGCEDVYRRGAQLIAGIMLKADEIAKESV